MARIVHGILVFWFLALAGMMFFAPMVWYQITPGVVQMGPFNMHFIMDIGLVFLMCALAMAYGLLRHNQTALVLGALWPCLHAAFHIFIWFQRGVPFDLIALSNLIGIQLPAWGGLFLALQLKTRSVSYA